MSKRIKIIITVPLVILGLTVIFSTADAAILSINPQNKEFAQGETFLVEVRLNSEQKVINTVEVTLNYPTDSLEVVEITRGGSFLTLWAQEPAFEESAGIITLIGGIPGGSYVVNGKVVTITFRTKMPGGAEIRFDEPGSKVLLNDGLGTKTELSFVNGIFNINDSQFITINSSTHPDEDAWYRKSEFTVSWGLKKEAKYSYVLSASPDEVPDNHSETSVGTVTFTDLTDGIFYFILKQQIPGEDWQVVGKRRTMNDNKSPLPIQTVITQEDSLFDGKFFLIFSTVDKISGIDRYDIIEGAELYRDATSPYVLNDQSRHEEIVVRAFDKAGNSISFTYPGFLEPVALPSNLSIILIALIAMILTIIFFIILSKRSKNKNAEYG